MALTDVATTDVVTASRETGVTDALESMEDQRVGSVIVTDGDDPVGIATDRMIAMGVREADSLADVTLEHVMTEDLVTIEADASHFEALETMSDEGIRRLPIVEDGSLTGIITLDDLIVVAASELSNVSDVIEQQTGSL